jgi:serine/threonine protein kinase
MFEKIKYRISPGFESLEGWVKNLPAGFAVSGKTIFKDRNEVKVFQEQGFELNVKAFKIPNLVNRIAYVYLRGSKAARSFQNAMRFKDAGASTPVPVAYLECLANGILRESYYISINYQTDFTLRDVLNNLVPDKENILIQWVRFTWQHLHRQGIYHLDYSPGNTLIRKEGQQYHFAVVDLNRMKFTPVNFEKGVQNFRQLDTDEETLRLIATEYASLCKEPARKAIDILLRFDHRNKAFRRRKNNFKRKVRTFLQSR